MELLTIECIKDLNKGDKVKITWLNKDGQEFSKQGTFHHIDIENNEVLIKQYRKRKQAWGIPFNSECRIEKIDKFENAKIEVNFNYFH